MCLTGAEELWKESLGFCAPVSGEESAPSGGNQGSSWKIVWSLRKVCQRKANYPPQAMTLGEGFFFCSFAFFKIKKVFSKLFLIAIKPRLSSSVWRTERAIRSKGKKRKSSYQGSNVIFWNYNVVNVVLYEYVFLPFPTPNTKEPNGAFLACGSPKRGL